MKATADDLYVVVNLDNQHFAFPAGVTREMVAMPGVTRVPQLPEHVRGVINLRGKVMPLIDLRLHLGLTSCLAERQELIEMMRHREQDHENWLSELRACVEEDREFTLATDPTQCAFGKWYYSFEADRSVVGSRMLSMLLKKFEEPHNRIHGVAQQAISLAKQDKHDGAVELIEKTKNTVLSEMVELFSQVRSLILEDTREIAVVLGDRAGQVAVAVDTVESVERLEAREADGDLGSSLASAAEYIQGIAQRGGNAGQMVLLLDLNHLMATELAGIQ